MFKPFPCPGVLELRFIYQNDISSTLWLHVTQCICLDQNNHVFEQKNIPDFTESMLLLRFTKLLETRKLLGYKQKHTFKYNIKMQLNKNMSHCLIWQEGVLSVLNLIIMYAKSKKPCNFTGTRKFTLPAFSGILQSCREIIEYHQGSILLRQQSKHNSRIVLCNASPGSMYINLQTSQYL